MPQSKKPFEPTPSSFSISSFFTDTIKFVSKTINLLSENKTLTFFSGLLVSAAYVSAESVVTRQTTSPMDIPINDLPLGIRFEENFTPANDVYRNVFLDYPFLHISGGSYAKLDISVIPPLLIDTISLPPGDGPFVRSEGVTTANNLTYIAGGSSQPLYIINTSTIPFELINAYTIPRLTGSNTNGSVGIDITSDDIIISSSQILNSSDPTNIQILADFSSILNFRHSIQNNILYSAVSIFGLQVRNITNLISPQILDNFIPDGSSFITATRLTISSENAYVIFNSAPSRLHKVEIIQPTNLISLANYTLPPSVNYNLVIDSDINVSKVFIIHDNGILALDANSLELIGENREFDGLSDITTNNNDLYAVRNGVNNPGLYRFSTNWVPEIINNNFPIVFGETTIITEDFLTVSDVETPAGQLDIVVSSLQGGVFRIITSGDMVDYVSYQQVLDHNFAFEHDGRTESVRFSLSVSDSTFRSRPVSGNINVQVSPASSNNQGIDPTIPIVITVVCCGITICLSVPGAYFVNKRYQQSKKVDVLLEDFEAQDLEEQLHQFGDEHIQVGLGPKIGPYHIYKKSADWPTRLANTYENRFWQKIDNLPSQPNRNPGYDAVSQQFLTIYSSEQEENYNALNTLTLNLLDYDETVRNLLFNPIKNDHDKINALKLKPHNFYLLYDSTTDAKYAFHLLYLNIHNQLCHLKPEEHKAFQTFNVALKKVIDNNLNQLPHDWKIRNNILRRITQDLVPFSQVFQIQLHQYIELDRFLMNEQYISVSVLTHRTGEELQSLFARPHQDPEFKQTIFSCITHDLIMAVAYLHENGVAHLAIMLSVLLLTPDGNLLLGPSQKVQKLNQENSVEDSRKVGEVLQSLDNTMNFSPESPFSLLTRPNPNQRLTILNLASQTKMVSSVFNSDQNARTEMFARFFKPVQKLKASSTNSIQPHSGTSTYHTEQKPNQLTNKYF